MADSAASLTLEKVAEAEGYETVLEMLEDHTFLDVVPACCEEYCSVEPDGVCPHGHLSTLRMAGLI